MDEKVLYDIANVMRRDVLKMTSAAGSGHPTSCLSCAEIISNLYFNEMNYDIKNGFNPDNDEFILSKGHAAPILYSALYHAKCIRHDLMKLRTFNSPLEGHPIPTSLKGWVKVATGSLGQGLSVGVGMALAGKLQRRRFRTYVLLGDSEIAEGSVYEALQLASYYKLDNLCAIVDANRLGQRGETMVGHNLKIYRDRFISFGWAVFSVDGHNIKHLIKAFEDARKIKDRPVVIIAHTLKGKGVSFLENKNGWHGKVLDKHDLKRALNEIPEVKFPKIKIQKPTKIKTKKFKNSKFIANKYKFGEEIATRDAYGNALASLARTNKRIIAVDAEVSDSTRAEKVKKAKSDQFIEAFVAEQNMVGIILGLSKKGLDVFGSTFSAFLSRAHDQIRMASLSSADFTLCGSHAGVSIGKDGASQMGLEDIAMFRALPNSIIFYPSDAVSAEKLILASLKNKGIKYIRTTRGKTPVIYKNNENFKIGDFKILKSSKQDRVVLIGSGITLHECLKAHDLLKKKKIETAVLDLYCVKPLDGKKLFNFAKSHGGKIVVVEDHYAEGGIGEMLAEEFENTGIKIKHLAVSRMPHSGESEELLGKYKINAKAVMNAALRIIKK